MIFTNKNNLGSSKGVKLASSGPGSRSGSGPLSRNLAEKDAKPYGNEPRYFRGWGLLTERSPTEPQRGRRMSAHLENIREEMMLLRVIVTVAQNVPASRNNCA